MSERVRALVFGEDAVSYDTARPSYPLEAIEHIIGLGELSIAVEVGAGTGKATVDVARDGLALTCLEPSEEMAAVLEAKGLPGVEVVVTTLEDWDGPLRTADLVYAAQAWHWVDGDTAYEKARGVLRPGGSLALLWNIPANRYSEYEDVYSIHAPQLLVDQDERIARRDSHDWLVDMRRAGFRDLEQSTFHWTAVLTAIEHRALYSTYSDHMMLPEPSRTRLLDALEEAVSSRGGSSTLEYRTEVFTGRV